MKDVAGCDKLRGSAKQLLIRRFPNGITPSYRGSVTEFIGYGSAPWELKHLSTRRNINQLRFRE